MKLQFITTVSPSENIYLINRQLTVKILNPWGTLVLAGFRDSHNKASDITKLVKYRENILKGNYKWVDDAVLVNNENKVRKTLKQQIV